MRLLVDIGNSGVKWAWQLTPAHSLSPSQRAEHAQPLPVEELFRDSPPPREWWLSSVHRGGLEWLMQWIQETYPDDRIEVVARQLMPLTLTSQQRQQAGLDRLLGVLAVNARRDAGEPAIFCDFGTATTCNAIAADGRFLGGVILPGAQTQLDALTRHTDQLPGLVASDLEHPPPLLGECTNDAILSGVLRSHAWGTAEIVSRFAEELARQSDATPRLWLTGGGMPRFFANWELPFVIAPQLILEGLALYAKQAQPSEL